MVRERNGRDVNTSNALLNRYFPQNDVGITRKGILMKLRINAKFL
jgi:hypothetical protein